MTERPLETVPDILAAQVAQRPDAVALIKANGDQFMFDGLAQAVNGLAASMLSVLPTSMERQARIGAAMPNGADFIVFQLAAMSIGTLLPFNPKSTAAEFEAVFELSELDVIVTPAGESSVAAETAEMLDIPALRMTSQYVIAGARPAKSRGALPKPDDIAALCRNLMISRRFF